MRLLIAIVLLAFTTLSTGAEQWGVSYDKSWVRYQFPQDEQKWWWDEAWWEEGKIPGLKNHDVIMEEVNYRVGDKAVYGYLFRPNDDKQYPAVYFQHGRRGLDDLTLLHPKRLAARGFIVYAPDLWFSNDIDKYPYGHEYVVESDAARGIEFLLTLPQVSTDKACVVSHTRGGYISLKALTVHKMQGDRVACWIAYYPHMQDPNAPEPAQIYGYAPEADLLTIPIMMFFGEHEQYQRHRPIIAIYEMLKQAGRDPKLIVYPGVGRGFEFRPEHVRTYADDLAAKDAMQRTSEFISKHLRKL